MKVRIKRPPAIVVASPYGVPNPNNLKRSVSLTDILAFHLDQKAESITDEKAMFHCLLRTHGGPDERASLWCYDDYRGTGFGRWGCPTCCNRGDDVFGFLRTFHNYSMAEALRWVQVWRMNHSGTAR